MQRTVLERTTPRFLPMASEPQLEAHYAAWNHSRAEWLEKMKRERPVRPVDQWQKRYYRGLDMDDKPGVPDHQAKLRLKPFVQGVPEEVAPPLTVDADRLEKAFLSVIESVRAGATVEASVLTAAGLPPAMADRITQAAYALA